MTPARRLRVWREMMHDQFLELERPPDADALRDASMAARPFDGGILGSWTVASQTVARTEGMLKQLSNECVFIAAARGIGACEQGDMHEVNPGDFNIVDGTRPFRVIVESRLVTQDFLVVPKASLTRRVGRLGDQAFGVFRANLPLQGLAYSYLRGLAKLTDEVNPATVTVLVEQALDLVALMIGEAQRASVDPSTHRAAMLLRIKLYVKSQVKNAALTIDQASAALGMSSRYINALLSSEGTSFGRFLLSQRLEGARREIMDPRRAHRQITEVAFDWGFNSSSHFGKAFKDKFGMTPRDAKMTAAFP